MPTIEARIIEAEERWNKSEKARKSLLSEMEKLRRGEKVDWRTIDTAARYRWRFERLGDVDSADAVVEGSAVDFNPLERIIGASQLSGIEFFERGITLARAIARVRIRSVSGVSAGFGTGVMISPRLFMTNNYVLENSASAANSIAEFGFLNSVAGAREPIIFRFQPQEFFVTDSKLDFTIVAVEAQSSTGQEVLRRGCCPLIAGSGKATKGERVNIIQHPSGERMQIAIRDNTIVGVVDDFLHYVADTQPVSSGSPVLNDQWEMAALHHAGKPKRDSDGRILMKNGQPWTGLRKDVHHIDWEANEGVRISSIVKHVKGTNMTAAQRTLWDRAFQAPDPVDIWELFEHACDCDEATVPGTGESVVRTTDDNGNPSWLFQLSFGPVSGPGMPGASRAQIQTVRAGDPAPIPAPGLILGGGNGQVREAAAALFEKFSHDGPYYDALKDKAASDAYWKGIDWKQNSKNLFEALHQRVKSTHNTSISYSRARHEFLYPAIDLHKDGKLRNIYSGTTFYAVDAIAREIAMLTPVAESMGLETSAASLESLLLEDSLWDQVEEEAAQPPFNCEHVVCQSWFDKEPLKRADIHHLFACEPRCNSFRSNITYWQFPPEDEGFMHECGRTEGRAKFEPAQGKGAVARATMYFLIRYPGEVGNEKGELTKSRVSILMDWHKSDPPGNYERHRNWLTEMAQGNRNPFIDRPNTATAALLTLGFGTA